MVEQPVKSIARSGERVEYQYPGCERSGFGDAGDISTDGVGELIAGTFHRGSPQDSYPSSEPIRRPEAVDANVVGITPTLYPVSLYLGQVQYRISFCPI
jgi:hypothetical protein